MKKKWNFFTDNKYEIDFLGAPPRGSKSMKTVALRLANPPAPRAAAFIPPGHLLKPPCTSSYNKQSHTSGPAPFHPPAVSPHTPSAQSAP